MLFIIATPIGNLEDFSHRALSTLQRCDAVLCEDTRRSKILLDRYRIEKKLISYHKFKEAAGLERILEELKKGTTFALLSDAGTPCINDPGQLLVRACRKEGIEVKAIPGPCSVILALVLSGFATNRFQFVGFLPKNPKEAIRHILCFPGTSIAFESPERLLKTLSQIPEGRTLAVVREMTKMFEECRIGTGRELLTHFQSHPPLGEIVLVFEEGPPPDDLHLEEIVSMLQTLHGLSLKEAIQTASRLSHTPKRQLYQKIHKQQR